LEVSHHVIFCAAQSFAPQLNRKDDALFVDLSGLSEMKLKLSACKNYDHDRLTAGHFCELAKVGSPGDKLILCMNKCSIFDSFSCGFRGYSLKGKLSTIARTCHEYP
jgi:hypothetical protein